MLPSFAPPLASLEHNLSQPNNPPIAFESGLLLIQSMSRLLQAQTDMLSAQAQAVAVQVFHLSRNSMLSAQAQAVAVQGLPPLKKFSGENFEVAVSSRGAGTLSWMDGGTQAISAEDEP